MTFSIRKFLLVNLLLAITVTTTLTALGNYYLDQRDIERHLDTLMVIAALSYQALLGPDITPTRLDIIQKSLDDLNLELDNYYHHRYISRREEHYANKFNFQVWDKDGNLLLHSPSAPRQPMSNTQEGFSDEIINGHRWRVFKSFDPGNQTYAMVGERYNTRRDLGHIIATDDIYIMMLTFPLSGLLIWIIIGQGLSSLKQIAEEVSGRGRNHLEPVKMQYVPVEIKSVIEEINKLFERLNDAFEREKRFAGDAAHELRTPLAILKNQAQIALKTHDNHEQQTALKNLVEGVDRSTHIVQQLLTMSRLVPQATYLAQGNQVDLKKAASDIIMQLVYDAIKKNIELELIDNTEGNAKIIGNETSILILIRNLIDNAIRYSQEGGMVRVILARDQDYTTLSVQDDGPGIPSELHGRVFERFFRVLGNKSPGSGLGLAIVQQICKLHQADIELGQGIDGKGLEMKIVFKNNPL